MKSLFLSKSKGIKSCMTKTYFIDIIGHFTSRLNIWSKKASLVLKQTRALCKFFCLILSVKICSFNFSENWDFFV